MGSTRIVPDAHASEPRRPPRAVELSRPHATLVAALDPLSRLPSLAVELMRSAATSARGVTAASRLPARAAEVLRATPIVLGALAAALTACRPPPAPLAPSQPETSDSTGDAPHVQDAAPASTKDTPATPRVAMQLLAPTPETARCESADLRHTIHCLTDVAQEAAIDELVRIARPLATRARDGGIDARHNFDYAAEGASRIAGRLRSNRLLGWANDPAPESRAFALHALGHLLRLLDMGYIRDDASDDAARQLLLAPVGDVCVSELRDDDALVVEEAIGCVSATEDARHTERLVALIVDPPDAELQRRAVDVIVELRPAPERLRPLTAVLERPLSERWTTDEVWTRAGVCRALRHASAPWASAPAKAAAREIGPRHSQAREICERTARVAFGHPDKPRSITDGKNYFATMDLERCRFYDGANDRSYEFCARSLIRAGDPRQRKFELTVRDPTRLTPDKNDHVLVARREIKPRPGEYMFYEMTTALDLSERVWLVTVPMVLGAPGEYGERRTLLLLYDTVAHRFRRIWSSPPCRGHQCTQDVQLRYRAGEREKTVLFIQDASTTISLRWDGARLHAPR